MSAVVTGNVSTVRKKFIDDNFCIDQMIQKKFNVGFAAIHKITQKELYMKKGVFRCIPHNLTEQQTVEHVIISKETLKLLYDCGIRIISKIITCLFVLSNS